MDAKKENRVVQHIKTSIGFAVRSLANTIIGDLQQKLLEKISDVDDSIAGRPKEKKPAR